ncbi:TetR/AcrR family transcriptional regulator [Streptomyces sp. NPDC058171]
MTRRMTPEARRAAILDTAQAVIAEEGYRHLTLRELARRCDMSAPGLMHYFADLPSLLNALLARRDDADIAEFRSHAYESAIGAIDDITAYYAARSAEARPFTVLEAEALDPGHPAHDYFAQRNDRTLEGLRPLVERDYHHADELLRVLRLVIDGLRLRVLSDPGRTDLDTDWLGVRDVLRDLFAPYARTHPPTAPPTTGAEAEAGAEGDAPAG